MKSRRRMILALALLVVCGAAGLAQAKESGIWLVKDGKAQGHLFLPMKMGRQLLLATEELRQYVEKMTGAELPIAYRAYGSRQKQDVDIQFLVRDPSEWEGKESSQAFTIVEESTGITISGNTEMAVLYGVYQYLHELGVRWFTPGEIGENVPELKDIPITARNQSYSPSFVVRGLSFSGGRSDMFDYSDPAYYRDVTHHDYDLWTLRNRTAFQRSIHNGHWFDFNDVQKPSEHALVSVALAGVSFEKEPERFAVVTQDGKKERREKGAQICFTNEKNINQCIESAVAYFREQEATKKERNSDLDELSDAFPLGLADRTGICECETCTRMAGAAPYNKDRLVWSFMNRVAKGLHAQMPGKKIGLYAPYYELTRPPADVTIEPNIVAMACRGTTWSADPEDEATYPFVSAHAVNMEATQKAGAEIRCYDYVLWKGTPQPLNILDALKEYTRRGINHYHVEVMSRNEHLWPILWAMGQYLWDSDQEPSELLAEYCTAYFGKAGPVVLELMEKIDANSCLIPRIGYGDPADTQAMLSDDLIVYGRTSLKKAMNRVQGKELERLHRFSETFEMFSKTAEAYRAYCEALNQRTPEAIAASNKAFADFDAFWETSQLQQTAAPNVRAVLKAMAGKKISADMEPVGNRELDNKDDWMRALFALAPMPDAPLPNLFSLPEIWKFRIDYADKGLEEGWQHANIDESKNWQSISTWNVFEKQGYYSINGRFWYRLTFDAPTFPAGKKVFLRMGSLDDEGDIYINGQMAYSRKLVNPDDWKSSFVFEVTELLKPGEENLIAIFGYDSFGAGGLWRPCALYTD